MHGLEILQALNERASARELQHALPHSEIEHALKGYEIPDTIEEIYVLAAHDLAREYR